MNSPAPWKSIFSLSKKADLTEYKLALISRLALVAIVFILIFGTLNIWMKYPLINSLIDVTGLLLMICVLTAVRYKKVMLASLSMTIGLVIAIISAAIVTYTEGRNNDTENLIIAIVVVIVAFFDGKLKVTLFLMSFVLLMWLKWFKIGVLELPADNDFLVELIIVAVVGAGIYFTMSFFKLGLQNYLDRVNLLNENLRKQQSALEDLNTEKDEIIGIVAHDLKNPLNVIGGMIPILKNELQEALDEDQEVMFQTLEDSSKGMMNHVRQILDVNKLETEGIKLDTQKNDLGELLLNLVKLHRHISDLKSVNIHCDIETGQHLRRVDGNYVNRIFENLLTNAIEFTPAKKSIYLWMENHGSLTLICFKDEGPGISEESRDKLFEKYETPYAKQKGDKSTGLGLFSVKKYLQVINGSIEYESKLGEGTTFKVKLTDNQ